MKRKRRNLNTVFISNKKAEIVPWFSKAEWEEVYQQLYSVDTESKKTGLKRISTWKCRQDYHAPFGIEATAAMVLATLEDKSEQSAYHTEVIKAIHADAIKKYVAFVYFIGKRFFKLQTKTSIVQKLNIPDWIINIRNQVSHGHLTSLTLLRKAIDFSLEWMKQNYWETELRSMKDVVGESERISDVTGAMAREQLLRYTQLKNQMLRFPLQDFSSTMKDNDDILQQYIEASGTVCANVLCEESFLFAGKGEGGDKSKHNDPGKEDGGKSKHRDPGKEDGGGKSKDNDPVSGCLEDQVAAFWAPVIAHFVKSHAVIDLLKVLLQQLGCKDPWRAGRALGWITFIITNIDRCGRPRKRVGSVDWKKLLRAVMEVPCQHTSNILKCIFDNMEPPLSAEVRDQLLMLVDICLGMPLHKSGRPGKTSAAHSARIYTTEDLPSPPPSSNTSSWQLCPDIPWWKYPVGVVPSQSGHRLPDLSLTEDLLNVLNRKKPQTPEHGGQPQNSEHSVNHGQSPTTSGSNTATWESPTKAIGVTNATRESPLKRSGRGTVSRSSPLKNSGRDTAIRGLPMKRSGVTVATRGSSLKRSGVTVATRGSPLKRSAIRGSPLKKSAIRGSPLKKSAIRGLPLKRSDFAGATRGLPLKRSGLARAMRGLPLKRSGRATSTRGLPLKRSGFTVTTRRLPASSSASTPRHIIRAVRVL